MTLSTACPKPAPSEPKPRKWLPRSTKPLKRTWIARSTKRIPQVNIRAAQRRRAKYNKVIVSDHHKQIRYHAFLRSGGYCECEQCVVVRQQTTVIDPTLSVVFGPYDADMVALATTPIPVWFTKKGKEPWERFRSKHGEVHHVRYTKFGKENPAELEDVRFCWTVCHQRIEAEHGTRRRYLNGAKA